MSKFLKHSHHLTLTAELLQCIKASGASKQKSDCASDFPKICREIAFDTLSNQYSPSPYQHFAVTEPKLREIYAPAFRDHIVQLWVTKQLTLLMERRFIDDTYANRKNKGTFKAIDKAQKLMRKPTHQWGLQLDIYSYFNNINKDILLKSLLELVETATFSTLRRQCLISLIEHIVMHDVTKLPNRHTGDMNLIKQIPAHKKLSFNNTSTTGIPIGSVTSQLFGNYYLSCLDHEIKHSLKVKGYIRYMDDLLLFSDTPDQLSRWKQYIDAYLKEKLKLKLHPTKINLAPVESGFNYLGVYVYPHYKHVRPSTIEALKRYLSYFNTLLDKDTYPITKPYRGVWSKSHIHYYTFPKRLRTMQSTINSYFGLLSHGNHCQLRKSLYHVHFKLLKKYFIPDNAYYTHFGLKKGLYFDKAAQTALCWPGTHEP
ncbi:RNA-directed DNA polymerase [Vibrio alginolyticus]|uniref:RNA-directed DNA polymerase n=1 Tax=Vibrio alginolyticus TaxID=663 RepID=UPI00215C8063|nr:RNA-directed DNA polymerase [Vibrio alginolyticus]MCR9570956.1 RNA-directed DNA polymerase [Vibrio alginolyticus]